MLVGTSYPKPLVVEPASGVHTHTMILLHGRGSSADTFGPALLNLPILTTSPFPQFPAITQTAEAANSRTVAIPGHTSALAEPATFVPLSDGVISEDTLSVKALWGPSASRAPPSADCHHHAPAKQNDLPTTLAEALPHARFVFPNAPRQRATVYKRSVMRQWFDDWHLRPGLSGDVVDCRYDEGLQTSGLGDTVQYLHELIAKEAELVGGVRNVVLGGMSQGCAASLTAALLWEGEDRLGAVVGMCGWLPYLTQMQEAMHAREDSVGEIGGKAEDFEFFERSASPPASPTPAVTGSVDVAISWLRDELEMPRYQGTESSSARCTRIPIMLCHGRDDKKVDCYQSRAAADFLLSVGMEVRHWRLYDGVDHDFSKEMLADILAFLLPLVSASRGS